MLRARRGEFCSAVEVALIASVTRMTAHRWLIAAGIDVAAARLGYLAKLHQQHQESVAALSGQKPLTAQERRRQTLKAVQRLNDAQVKRHTQSGRAVPLEAQAEDGKPD
jgi:hypothetical protein